MQTYYSERNKEIYEFDPDHMEKYCEDICVNLAEAKLDIDLLISEKDSKEKSEKWIKEYGKVTRIYGEVVDSPKDLDNIIGDGETVTFEKRKAEEMGLSYLIPVIELVDVEGV